MKHFVMGEYDNPNQEVNTDKFFKKLEELCRKFNVSISHEDGHGAFILEDFDEFNMNWIKVAHIEPSVRDRLNRMDK